MLLTLKERVGASAIVGTVNVSPRGLHIHGSDTSAALRGKHVKPLVTKREIAVVVAPEKQKAYEQTFNSLIPSSSQS